MPKTPQDEIYSEEETVARREAALKRAFAMPHKPHRPKDSAFDKKDSNKGERR